MRLPEQVIADLAALLSEAGVYPGSVRDLLVDALTISSPKDPARQAPPPPAPRAETMSGWVSQEEASAIMSLSVKTIAELRRDLALRERHLGRSVLLWEGEVRLASEIYEHLGRSRTQRAREALRKRFAAKRSSLLISPPAGTHPAETSSAPPSESGQL